MLSLVPSSRISNDEVMVLNFDPTKSAYLFLVGLGWEKLLPTFKYLGKWCLSKTNDTFYGAYHCIWVAHVSFYWPLMDGPWPINLYPQDDLNHRISGPQVEDLANCPCSTWKTHWTGLDESDPSGLHPTCPLGQNPVTAVWIGGQSDPWWTNMAFYGLVF